MRVALTPFHNTIISQWVPMMDEKRNPSVIDTDRVTPPPNGNRNRVLGEGGGVCGHLLYVLN